MRANYVYREVEDDWALAVGKDGFAVAADELFPGAIEHEIEMTKLDWHTPL